MAVKVTRDVICDICGGQGAKRWAILRRDNRVQRTGDLCLKCEDLLKPFLDAFEKAPKGRTPRREVLTPAQIKNRAKK